MIDWRARLFRRSLAYRQCFLGDDGQLTPAAKIVLADLAKFAAVMSGPTIVSPLNQQTDVPATFQRVGRAEMFHRVMRYLRLPVHSLYDIEEHAKNE
jgi:hypothetical protein